MPATRDPEVFFENSYIPEPNSGCWIWERTLCDGYGLLSVARSHRSPMLKYHMVRAHRFAWELFKGPIPDGMHVLHRCDVRCCVNPDHLFLGTEADNSADKIAKGRDRHASPAGERNPMAKLAGRDVAEIKHSRENWKALAQKYGVHHQTIWKIRSGLRWSDR